MEFFDSVGGRPSKKMFKEKREVVLKKKAHHYVTVLQMFLIVSGKLGNSQRTKYCSPVTFLRSILYVFKEIDFNYVHWSGVICLEHQV